MIAGDSSADLCLPMNLTVEYFSQQAAGGTEMTLEGTNWQLLALSPSKGLLNVYPIGSNHPTLLLVNDDSVLL